MLLTVTRTYPNGDVVSLADNCDHSEGTLVQHRIEQLLGYLIPLPADEKPASGKGKKAKDPIRIDIPPGDAPGGSDV
jgi:hypothetical protein